MSEIERMTITLPSDMVAAVKGAVEGGDYASSSEVVREALCDWEMKRTLQLQDVAALNADIDKGLTDLAKDRVKDFDAARIIERGRKLLASRSLSYVRQKVWEALGCLVSTKQFRDRLAAAVDPLSQLKYMHPHLLQELPEDVRGKYDDVMQALTRQPPEWKGDSRASASVRILTPRQRTKIAQSILEIYVAVSGGL